MIDLLVRAVQRRDEWDDEIDRLVVQAMDAGVNRVLIASTIGKSREYLRTVRDRVSKREGHATPRSSEA